MTAPLPREAPATSPSWGLLARYAGPALGASAPFLFVQFYFLNFATDVLLLAPASVGAMLAAARIWDAVSDPLVGTWSDRTRGGRGRRRPWMLVAAPLGAVAFAALWNPPRAWGAWATALWCGAGVLAVTTAITAWTVPHQALGAELARDPLARSRLFGFRFVSALLGAVLAFAGMQWVINAEDPRAAVGQLAIAGAVLMAGVLLVPALTLREPAATGAPRLPESPRRAWRGVFESPLGRRVLFVWFAFQLAGAAQGAVAPYTAKYVLLRPDWVGVFPVFYILPLLLSVPLWIRLADRYGALPVWRASLWGCALAYLGLLALRPDDLLRAGVLLGAAGFWSGASGPLGPALLAEAIDVDAARSGQARSGVFFAAKEFVEKAGGAAVAVVTGLALHVSGFEPNIEQGPAALWAIKLCLGGLPAVMLALGALALRGPGDRPAEPAPARGLGPGIPR